MSVGIYKFTNLVNGKKYIGQSVNLKRRINRHKTDAYCSTSNSYNYPLEEAIREIGLENFKITILEKCRVDELDEREIFWINYYNSFFEGYNQTRGGGGKSGPVKLTKEELLEITDILRHTQRRHQEIADQFNVSREMIQGINTGRYWKRDIDYPIQKKEIEENFCIDCKAKINRKAIRCVECSLIERRVVERPNPLILAEKVVKQGFEATGREYGVSGNAIKKWCVSYNIGRLKHEVAIWYEKNKKGDVA